MKLSSTLLSALLLAALGARAATPTDTPTFTASPTPSATPIVGDGSYTVSPALFTIGDPGNGADITYASNLAAWPSGGGLLTLYFPLGFDAPNASNFYVHPAYAAKVASISYAGQSATVRVKDLPAGGATVVLRYGQNASGFTAGVNAASASLFVSSFPGSVSQGSGAPLAAQPTIALQSPTATFTPTVTLTATISPTFTESPTETMTPTITMTFTETPVAAFVPDTVFSYPNPFDMAKFDKVTFRFPPDPDAKITVFNLSAEPVRELPLKDVNGPAGWAVWNGKDDYGNKVTGGLYFVRVRGAKTLTRKFTVVF